MDIGPEATGHSQDALLAATRVVAQPDDFVLVGLPRGEAAGLAAILPWAGKGFVSVMVDDAEASAVLPSAAWAGIAARLPGARVAGPYRLLTFDIALDLAVVGYLAAVSAALAARGISIYALSAYGRDHILVRRLDVEAAQEVLDGLMVQARGATARADGN